MRIVSALLCLLLAACAGTPDATGTPAAGSGGKLWYSVDNRAGLTPDELTILTERLETDLAAVHVPAGTPGANHLRITITGYRMLHESGRAVVGMVAGSDHIASTVQLIDPASNRLIDEERVLSRPRRAIGAAPDLLRAHADEITRAIVD